MILIDIMWENGKQRIQEDMVMPRSRGIVKSRI